MTVNNTGHGIAIAGICIAAALFNNYYVLLLCGLPMLTWQFRLHKINNERAVEEHKLEMTKLREEIRLLKVRKK